MATTATPGSVTPTARPESRVRFTATERWLHWLHASAFVALLATGLILYVPSLSEAVGRRATVKAVHLGVAVGWMAALALVALLGDRGALRRTLREIDRFDAQDTRWLTGRRARSGRFNAGQKLHAVVQGALAVLFAVSGTLLWIVQRDTTIRLPGTIALHDTLTFVLIALLAGHLWLALVWPRTRPALRGMVLGAVRSDWASAHHPRWAPGPPSSPRRLGRRSVAAAVAVLAAGAWAAQFVVTDALGGSGPRRAVAAASRPAAPSGLELAAHAQALDQSGDVADAIPLYERAVAALPRRADVRASLGFALARAGRGTEGLVQLRGAVALDPAQDGLRLYLGAVELQLGHTAAGRAQLHTVVARHPAGPAAAAARRLLRGP